MPDLYIFKAQVGMFEPTQLQDHNVCIHYVQTKYYRKVNFLEAIPPFQCINLGALAAGGVSARQNVVNLEMPNNEFGLFRWYVIDDAQVRLYHPAGIAKAQLRWLQVPFDMAILFNDPNLVSTEIAVWENNRPAMDAINGSPVTPLGGVRIRALGYRFHTADPLPLTAEEARVCTQLKSQTGNAQKEDTELMEMALQQKLLPCTDVWCSGRAIGD